MSGLFGGGGGSSSKPADPPPNPAGDIAASTTTASASGAPTISGDGMARYTMGDVNKIKDDQSKLGRSPVNRASTILAGGGGAGVGASGNSATRTLLGS